jgi:hypothetical protein
MFKVISKWQRPSLDVNFYRRGESATQASTNAKIAGNLVSEETFLSPDRLTMTYVANWDTIESYNQFNLLSEVLEYVQARDVYNDSNNVTLMLKKTETISA